MLNACRNSVPAEDLSSLPYEMMDALPVQNSATTIVPINADSAYVYSYEQNRQRGKHISYFQSQAASARIGYTQKLPLGRDFQKRFADWCRNHPDGVIVGYHTPSTKEFHPGSF